VLDPAFRHHEFLQHRELLRQHRHELLVEHVKPARHVEAPQRRRAAINKPAPSRARIGKQWQSGQDQWIQERCT
jgi:hypothetical protein